MPGNGIVKAIMEMMAKPNGKVFNCYRGNTDIIGAYLNCLDNNIQTAVSHEPSYDSS